MGLNGRDIGLNGRDMGLNGRGRSFPYSPAERAPIWRYRGREED